jgi:hypothetical protein
VRTGVELATLIQTMTVPQTAQESGAVLRSKISAVSAAGMIPRALTVLGCRTVSRVATNAACATAIPATTIFEIATAYAFSMKDTGRTCR